MLQAQLQAQLADLQSEIGQQQAEAARAQPKRRRTTILVYDEPPPADEDARDDNDPSAPAVMHVPAHGHGEYNKRKCFGINKQ